MHGLAVSFQNEIGSCLVNDIYAIDPSAPQDLRDLKLLAELFGFSHGRFIAEYPAEWALLLQGKFKDLRPIEQSRASVLLAKFLSNTLPVEGRYLRSKDWLTNVLDFQSKEHKFKKIVAANEAHDLPTLSQVLYEDELPDSRGEHIKPTINSYRFAIAPLFIVSSEIHIQDMYFFLEDGGKKLYRQWDVLHMLIDLAVKSGRCKTLIFHLNQEKFPTNSLESRLEECFDQVLINTNNNSLEILYTLEDKKITHGRYIFSIKGGLQFDHGFDTDIKTQDKLNHVHWLSKNELQPLFDRYGI